MINRMNALAVSVAFAALGLVATGAQAAVQAEEGTVQVTVSYSDLDISHAAGAKALLSRIERVAVQACGGVPPGGYQLRQRPELDAFNHCRHQATNNAVASIHSPILTAMFSGKAAPELLAAR